MRKPPIWNVWFLLLSVGCEPIAPTDSARLEREVSELRKMASAQAQNLGKQSGEIELLKMQLEWMQNKAVPIDVSDQSYQCIETNTGKFLIACDNVQTYAEGQKLTFRIGNPNFITFSGFKLKAKWGLKAPKYADFGKEIDPPTKWQTAYSLWQKAVREKEIDSPIELRPGIWNTVEIVLSPAKVEDLGYLELSMQTDKVMLLRDKPN